MIQEEVYEAPSASPSKCGKRTGAGRTTRQLLPLDPHRLYRWLSPLRPDIQAALGLRDGRAYRTYRK